MLPETLPSEPSPEELLFQQAVESIRQEKFAQAREILTRLLRTDQNNPDYWVWLSAAMETPKERLYCLQTAFKMDPTNAGARRGLTLLGALPPDEMLKPFPMNHPRPWEAKIKLTDEKPKITGWKLLTSNPSYRLGALIGVGIILILGTLMGVGLFVANRPAATQEALGTSRPTVTPYATNSNQSVVAQSTTRPLAELLSTPYTPTPIYAATPHGDAAGDSYKGAMRAYNSGQWDTVGIMMAQVATAQPGSADALYFMGEARRMSGNYQDAIDLYNLAIGINANYAPSYLGRARATFALNSKKNVIPDLNKAIDVDSNYVEAYLERGLYYFQKKDLKSAQTDLEQAAALRDSPLVEINLARVLLALDENAAALEAAKKANELDLTMVDGYLVLGMAYRANGQIDQAVDVLETYLKYQPDNAEAFAVLGAAYYNRGDYETALKNLKQAVRLDSTNSDGYFWMGQIYMEQKDYTNALSSYQTSLRLDSTSFDAAEGAAKADMAQGDYNNAYAVIAKVEAYAKTDAERARFLYIRAVSLEQLNLPDPAYRDWTALLALPPEALTDEMRAKAQVRVVELRSPTPIPGTSTPSRTPSPTSPPATRQPSKTPKPTATRAASATPVVLTPTASATPVVIMEATLTPTPKK
jgi:tetratricopeptide (TPR) repeat protein